MKYEQTVIENIRFEVNAYMTFASLADVYTDNYK